MIGPIRKIILLITMRLHYTKPLRIHFKIKSEISVHARHFQQTHLITIT